MALDMETHLVVNTEHAVRAREMFADTDINITTDILERLLAPDLMPKNMCGEMDGRASPYISQTQPPVLTLTVYLESLVLSVSNHPGYHGPAKSTGGGGNSSFFTHTLHILMNTNGSTFESCVNDTFGRSRTNH